MALQVEQQLAQTQIWMISVKIHYSQSRRSQEKFIGSSCTFVQFIIINKRHVGCQEHTVKMSRCYKLTKICYTKFTGANLTQPISKRLCRYPAAASQASVITAETSHCHKVPSEVDEAYTHSFRVIYAPNFLGMVTRLASAVYGQVQERLQHSWACTARGLPPAVNFG